MHRKHDPVVEQLRAVAGLAGLDDRTLRALARCVDEVQLPAGRTLTREGERGREAFIVTAGTGSVLVNGEVIATVGPGDFVGEMAMLELQPRSATVRADTSMTALALGRPAFNTFVDHPSVAMAIATQLSQRLRRVETEETVPATHAVAHRHHSISASVAPEVEPA